MFNSILHIVKAGIQNTFRDIDTRARKNKWNKKWGESSYIPWWQTELIAPELQEAVNQKWFKPQSTVLDIGCGIGESSKWLATQGFQVVGMDLSEIAIRRARSTFLESNSLLFMVDDVLQLKLKSTFNALFDRGCLHGLLTRQRAQYIQNIAGLSVPGTRFLLLHKVCGLGELMYLSPSELIAKQAIISEQIINDFSRSPFKITSLKLTEIAGNSLKTRHLSVPAFSVRMIHL